jgi:hypothetical protein
VILHIITIRIQARLHGAQLAIQIFKCRQQCKAVVLVVYTKTRHEFFFRLTRLDFSNRRKTFPLVLHTNFFCFDASFVWMEVCMLMK